MEILRASLTYLLSLIAAKVLRWMTPIQFEDKDCFSGYTTRVDDNNYMYIVTVNQWHMASKTRVKIFSNTTRYYQTEMLVLTKGEVILTRKNFYPEPTTSLLKSTKLPHAIVALAELDKVKLLMMAAEVRA